MKRFFIRIINKLFHSHTDVIIGKGKLYWSAEDKIPYATRYHLQCTECGWIRKKVL